MIERASCQVRAPFSWERLIIAAGLVAAVWYVLSETGALNIAPTDAQGRGLVAVFGVGMVAAFSSCTAVVSGLLVALSSRAATHHVETGFLQKMKPHVAFNVGRVFGFIGFGALVGAIGSTFALSSQANGVLVLVIALLMVGIGVDLLGVLPSRFAIRPPAGVSRRFHDMIATNNPFVLAALGAATFFLPCGFTQSMQLYALSTGSPMHAAMIMGVFSLGTLPALLGFGAATSAFRGEGLRKMTYAVGVFVVALGISNASNGAALLGFSGFSAPSGIPVTMALIDGKQVVPMEASAFGYSPEVIRVEQGIPVDWQIYGDQSLGCASVLNVPAFGISQPIVPGENRVAFTPEKAGTFVFTCAIGHLRGAIVVFPASGA